MPSDRTDLLPGLRSLLPEQVACVEVWQAETLEPLLAGEDDEMDGAVEQRLREYRAGRHCARCAMRLLGLEASAVFRGPDRAPRWPEGLVGSITHTGRGPQGYAAAAVARRRDVVSLGIDVELGTPLDGGLVDHVLTPDEIEGMAHGEFAGQGTRAKLMFAAKEAVYKCQYPLTHTILEFHDIQIEVDTPARHFRAVFRRAVGAVIPAGTCWTGRCSPGGRFVMAAVVLPSRLVPNGGDSPRE